MKVDRTRGRGPLWARLGAFALTAALLAAPAQAQDAPGVVESVDIAQNQYLQKETLLFYVSTKPGERYDENRLKADFRRLWDTGFLDDLALDVRDGKTGKIVTFVVRERKRISVVDYRGQKSITTTNIEDELKKREAALRIDSFYEPSKANHVADIIKEMLIEKGRPFAAVKHEAKNLGGGTQVSFIIEEGPKGKVTKITFAGNEKFSDSKLRGQMKKIKQKGFWNFSWVTGKTSFTPEKWSGPEGDQERLREFFLDHGYVTATVGEPNITYTDGKAGFFKKKPVKWAHLDIPVSEGDQYRVGTVKFEGLTVFKEEGIRQLFHLEEGDVYHEARLKKGYDKLRDLYGSQGYFQFTGFTKRNPDAEKKVVDLVLTMEEDKKYYVGRISFTGNDTTRDKVIRREVYMNEGDVFNTEALKMSIRRINQLGYFKPMEGAPDLRPSTIGEDKLDVNFKVEEQNRNQFTFGGGVSGLEGTFINASFSTSNFLGLGETFQMSAQSGARTKNYQIAVTEPYLLDKPITAGFDVYRRKLTYQTFTNVPGYTDDRTGVSLVTGFALGHWSRMFMSYAYEVVDITGLDTTNNGEVDPNSPVFDLATGKRRESRITPSWVRNTVDNPYSPHRGTKLNLSLPVAGGPLGGTLDYLRPEIEGIWYIPHTKRTALGLRLTGSMIIPYGDTKILPYYLRFFLGGETQIRGYNVRSVGPLDTTRTPPVAIGGNKYAIFNAEYYIDIAGPLRFLFFYDAGQAFEQGARIELKKFRTSTGAELRFIMPVLNVPFRLIYAFNPQRDDFQPKSTFKFAVGTTF